MKKVYFFFTIMFLSLNVFGQNIAPLATATASTCNTGACGTLNDLNFGTCGTQQMWITTGTPPDPTPGVNWIQWDWTTPRTINQFVIHHAQNNARFLTGATIQSWNGSSWVNVGSFTNLTMQCINTVNINAVTTSRIRFTSFLMQGTGQLSNPNFREIEIFGPSYRNDAGVNFITNPDVCNTPQQLSATVFNYGLRRLDSVRLNWSVNGVPQPTQYLTTSLLTGQSTTVTLNSNFNFAPSTNYNVEAWTSMPNGFSTDSGAANDRFTRLIEFLGNPNAPTVNNSTQCGQGISSLMATPDNSGDSILWYDQATGGLPFTIGKNAKGPFLTSSRTFYAQSAKIASKNNSLVFSGTTGVNVTQANDYGGMFTVNVLNDVVLDSMMFRLWYATPTNTGFQLYYKTGAYTGFQTNSAAWTKLTEGVASFVNVNGLNFAKISAKQIMLPAGTYSFYFTTDLTFGAGNAIYSTFGGAGPANSELAIQTGGSIIIGKFGGTQILAAYQPDVTMLYRKQCYNTTRVPYTITVKPRPIGADVVKGAVFQGLFNEGLMFNPDVTEVGKTVTYELTPPTGFTNGGHGSTWVINSISARTKGNVLVPSSAYSVVAPSSSTVGSLTFTPTSAYLDSFITFSINYSDLGPHFCDSTLRRTIVVAPTPQPNFSFNNSICVGDIVIFENLSTIHSGFMTYQWYFGDGDSSDLNTPNHTYTTSGIKSVRLIATNSLWKVTKDTIINISVGELPNIAFTPINACEGQDIRFNNNTTISAGTLNYTWNFGDGSPLVNTTSNNPLFKRYSTSGGYRVTLIAESAGCINTLTKTAYQFAKPNPNFELLSGSCSNNPFQFVNTSSIKFGSFGNKWDFSDNGNIASDENTTYTFQNAGTKMVKLTNISEFGCRDSITKPIEVKQAPITDFSYPFACERAATPFTNLSNLFNETLIKYTWTFGNGTSNATSPIRTWSSLGPRNVTLKTELANGCSSEITKVITVGVQPLVDFEFENQCQGNEAIFTNLSSARFGNITYKWSFGDGGSSTTFSPTHTYTNPQSFTVKLVADVQDGCKDSATKVIDISQAPVTCDFNFTRDWNVDKKRFNFTPIGGSTSGINYTWIMGDGNRLNSTSAGTSYTFNTDIRYCVTMIASNQAGCECKTTKCVDVATDVNQLFAQSISIYPNPSNGLVNVKFDNNVNQVSLKVYNSLGQIVINKNYDEVIGDINVDLSQFSKGIYSFTIQHNQQTTTKNVIIQ
jgi:PKD repeat protein